MAQIPKGGAMKIRHGIAVSTLLTVTMGSVTAAGFDWKSERYLLDKEGGTIEVQTTQPDDKRTRDAVRQQLQQEVRYGIPFTTPAMQQHKKQIQYRYEKTTRGGRIHITAKSGEALLAVQDFLRSQMSKSPKGGAVVFDYVASTLVVVPVMINDHGPYKFLLDTGTTKTVLSAAVADSLKIPSSRSEILLSAGGNRPVSIRAVRTLEVGATRLENVEIAVANWGLMKQLGVDGILGGDYLRRFKVSINYDNRTVEIEPTWPEDMSSLVT
jgi:predicted aspartyl protease